MGSLGWAVHALASAKGNVLPRFSFLGKRTNSLTREKTNSSVPTLCEPLLSQTFMLDFVYRQECIRKLFPNEIVGILEMKMFVDLSRSHPLSVAVMYVPGHENTRKRKR